MLSVISPYFYFIRQSLELAGVIFDFNDMEFLEKTCVCVSMYIVFVFINVVEIMKWNGRNMSILG